MRFTISTVVALFALSVTPDSVAHPGHDVEGPTVSDTVLKDRARGVVAKLIAAGELDSGWRGLTADDPLAEDLGGVRCWMLKVRNPQAASDERKTLYVFLAESGSVLGANFKGPAE